MPPKKNTKKADDWESELGETPEAAAATTDPITKDIPAEADAEEEFPAGGLMAMMRKNKKKKKEKQLEDLVEGEDPPAVEGQSDLAEKAPVEASVEDEFVLLDKKAKGKTALAKSSKDEDEDEEMGADGKVLTKAQKEKLKKEREKQRKKENVSRSSPIFVASILILDTYRLLRREPLVLLRRSLNL